MRAAAGSRSRTYITLTGIAVGAVAAGMLIPFVLGERSEDVAVQTSTPGTITSAAGEDAAGGTDALDAGTTTTTDTTAVTTDTTAAPAPGAGPSVARSAGAGAGGTGGGGGVAAVGAPAAPGAAPLTASDVGVTPTTVKLGVVLLDLSTARSVGLAPENYEVSDQRAAYETFVNRLNEQGGLNGRKVQTVYAVADPFKKETAEAACIKLTRDEKVFAVVAAAGFRGTASLCITRENRTPLVAQGHHPNEYFAASAGLLVTDLPSSERVARMYVALLDRLGVLKGKKVGVVTNQDTTNGEKQGGDAVVAALKAFGYEVKHRTDLSADLPTGAGQIPVQVQQMRSAGVDAVVLASNFLYSTQFAQAGDGQGWRPAWFAGQIGDMTSDALAKNMPNGFDGAIAVSSSRFTHDASAGLPEEPVGKDCREYFNAKSGKRYPYGGENPVLASCAGIRVFAAAAQAAGPNLTRGTYVAATQRAGRFTWPGMLGGSLSQGKFDFADEVRPLRWKAACKCYNVAGDAQRVG